MCALSLSMGLPRVFIDSLTSSRCFQSSPPNSRISPMQDLSDQRVDCVFRGLAKQ